MLTPGLKYMHLHSFMCVPFSLSTFLSSAILQTSEEHFIWELNKSLGSSGETTPPTTCEHLSSASPLQRRGRLNCLKPSWRMLLFLLHSVCVKCKTWFIIDTIMLLFSVAENVKLLFRMVCLISSQSKLKQFNGNRKDVFVPWAGLQDVWDSFSHSSKQTTVWIKDSIGTSSVSADRGFKMEVKQKAEWRLPWHIYYILTLKMVR